MEENLFLMDDNAPRHTRRVATDLKLLSLFQRDLLAYPTLNLNSMYMICLKEEIQNVDAHPNYSLHIIT